MWVDQFGSFATRSTRRPKMQSESLRGSRFGPGSHVSWDFGPENWGYSGCLSCRASGRPQDVVQRIWAQRQSLCGPYCFQLPHSARTVASAGCSSAWPRLLQRTSDHWLPLSASDPSWIGAYAQNLGRRVNKARRGPPKRRARGRVGLQTLNA